MNFPSKEGKVVFSQKMGLPELCSFALCSLQNGGVTIAPHDLAHQFWGAISNKDCAPAYMLRAQSLYLNGYGYSL